MGWESCKTGQCRGQGAQGRNTQPGQSGKASWRRGPPAESQQKAEKNISNRRRHREEAKEVGIRHRGPQAMAGDWDGKKGQAWRVAMSLS